MYVCMQWYVIPVFLLAHWPIAGYDSEDFNYFFDVFYGVFCKCLPAHREAQICEFSFFFTATNHFVVFLIGSSLGDGSGL